ncbi:MAG: SDR family NAD(P)-dependent oxidoreductase [Bacteroidota bacterium]
MSNSKIALITGVSREMGLGFEIAKQLIPLGYTVIVSARKLEQAQHLADQIGAQALSVDIADDASVAAAAKEIERQFGKLDVLINNAGAFFDQGADPLAVDPTFMQAAFDTNLFGAWRMIMAFLPLLKKSEAGRIVNVSSEAGSHADPVFGLAHHFSVVPVYSLTKLALNGLTVKLAKALEGTSVKINSASPGFVATFPGTEQYGARPVSEGAKSIVWAATIPNDGPSGKFFRDGEELGW